MKRVKGSSTMRRSTAWILSAALVLSACPITADAEELTENGSESVAETSQAVDESETAEQTEGERLNEGENTNVSEDEKEDQIQESSIEEDIQEESTQETSVEETTEEVPLEDDVVYLNALIGNVTRTCPTIGKDGEVTFHYYPQDGEKVESAYVKGSWSGDWSQYFYMTEDENGVWSATTQLSLEKSYEYGIVVNDNWVGDATNPRNGGNSEILRNPVYNADGSVSIFYYPSKS